MLHYLQPLVQSLLCIPLLNRYFFPAYDRPGIHLWCHIVDAAPGDLHTGIQGLFDCMQASEDRYLCAVASGIGTSRASIRQERGMDVNDTLGEVFEEGSAEDAHPAGKHNQVDLK